MIQNVIVFITDNSVAFKFDFAHIDQSRVKNNGL